MNTTNPTEHTHIPHLVLEWEISREYLHEKQTATKAVCQCGEIFEIKL